MCLLKKLFIYLPVLGLSFGIWDQGPWPWIKPRPPALRVQIFSHWPTREVLHVCLFFFFFNFIVLYNTVLVLPYIDMNPPWVYVSSQTWTPSHLPSRIVSLDHPRAPAPSILYPASSIDWRFVSYMIVYRFPCHSPKSSHPLPMCVFLNYGFLRVYAQ